MIDLTDFGSLSRPIAAAVVVLALGFVTVLAASQPKIESRWAEKPVAIDGVNTEWPVLSTIDKNVRLSIGVQNDDRNLYIGLITSDSATGLQALNEGLIVWFDVEGGTKKRFGIHYPVSRMSGRGGGEGGGARGDTGKPGGPPGDGQAPDPEEMWKRALADLSLSQAEVLGPGKDDRHPLQLDAQQAIQAKIGRADAMMVYELAVPLAKNVDVPLGLGLAPGSVIGIGIETPERPSVGGPGGEPGGVGGGMGGRGGGMGGRGGGMGGRGGGMGGPGGEGGRGRELQKPIKAWTTVRLAVQK